MKTLPIGIDLGATAIRMAILERVAGEIRLAQMLRIARPDFDPLAPGHAIATALRNAGVRERRCVTVLNEQHCTVRVLDTPPLAAREYASVAQLEAQRIYGIDDALAHVTPQRCNGKTVAGIARKSALTHVKNIVKSAGLRLVAVDHPAFALARLFPQADAIVDVGYEASRFYALHGDLPWSTTIDGGGRALTKAIALAYTLDEEKAERRKIDRSSIQGAEQECEVFIERLGRAIRTARSHGERDIEHVIMVGNGARVMEILPRLERDTGCLAERGNRLNCATGRYDADVVQAALPDWAMAIGAATWSVTDEVTSI